MTWKHLLTSIILEIDKDEFTSDDIWRYMDRITAAFPNAKNLPTTALRTLSIFRDMGAIEFMGRGHYRLTPEGRKILEEVFVEKMSWSDRIRRDWDRYYPQYMQSSHWKVKCRQVLHRDGHLCICGQTATVVHHKRYDNVGKEPLSDLASLCEECHTDFHAILKERRGW